VKRIARLGKLSLIGGALAIVASLTASTGCTITECKESDPDCGSSGSGASVSVGNVTIESLGSETVDSSGETEVTVEVPAGAQSFALVVDGAGGELVVATKITSPSGQVVFDFQNDISINRTDATDGLYTMLVPTNPAVAVEEGDWLINLVSGNASFEANLTQVTKTAPAVDRLLDLNVYVVGLDGIDAATLEADANFLALLENVNTIYGGASIGIRTISYHDISGSDGDTYGVIDSDAELAQMFALSPSESNVSLNIFLVNDIATGGAGFSTLGLAGGVPGPPVLQGTTRSGVAVNMGSYLAAVAGGDPTAIADASAELEIIIAHESGHFLGLYHTVERNGAALAGGINGSDPLADTPECADASDADMDGVLDPSECVGQGTENLMFWSPPNDSRALTSNQGAIMLANPLIH
jgi:hypothetical protein